MKNRMELKIKLKNILNMPLQMGKQKVFCISMQRNGTTSVGDFLTDQGYRVARFKDSRHHKWTYLWYVGNFEAIFNSIAFKSYQAYEDDPWWMPDFYKVLYHRFPSAKFILFYRDSNEWFDSMINHSSGKTLGNTRIHCKIYRRLGEFYKKIDSDAKFKPVDTGIDNLLFLNGMREHYIQIYEEFNREAIEYFDQNKSKRLFLSHLKDEKKWVRLGKFLNIDVDPEYNIHSNKTNNYDLKRDLI